MNLLDKSQIFKDYNIEGALPTLGQLCHNITFK